MSIQWLSDNLPNRIMDLSMEEFSKEVFDDQQVSKSEIESVDDSPSGLTGAIGNFAKYSRESTDSFVGRLLHGKFLVESRIGGGGAGAVFLATDKTTGAKVAVKILNRSALRDPASSLRFSQETRVTRYLKNPFIVRVYEYGEEDEQPYFVMDYLGGA